MSKRKINKLSDLKIDEVSLVDRGANQHAELLISKRDDSEDEIDKANPDSAEMYVEGEEEEDEDEDEKKNKKSFFKSLASKLFDESTTMANDGGNITHMEDVEKAGMMPGMQMPYGQQPMGQPAPGPQNAMPQTQAFPAQPMPGQMPPGQAPGQQMPGQMQAGPPLPDEVVQYIQQLEQALSQAQGGNQPNKPSGSEEEDDVSNFGKNYTDEEDLSFLEELAKSLSEEEDAENVSKVYEIVEKANARAEAAEEIAKAEREYRLNQEYIAKARAYSNLPVSAEEFGPVLKKVTETLTEDELGLLNKALSTANESIASMQAFDEIGKRGGYGFESVSKADSEAEAIAKEEGISKEAALTKVFEQNPGLYDEYLEEGR